jgi:hypothetical protein
MSDRSEQLIPAPPEVRRRLAEHVREGRLLRSLYRLSVRAAEERQRHSGSAEASSAGQMATR